MAKPCRAMDVQVQVCLIVLLSTLPLFKWLAAHSKRPTKLFVGTFTILLFIYLCIYLIYLFILDGEVPLSVPRTIRSHQPWALCARPRVSLLGQE